MKHVVISEEDSGKLSFPLSACGEMDPRLVSVLLKAELPCFLKHHVKNDGQAPTHLEVSVGDAPSLAARLSNPVNVADLAALFGSLHELIEACAYHGLPFMNIVMDARHIYLDDGLAHLRFIYLPVSGKVKGIAWVKEFFQELDQQIQPADDQVAQLRQRYRNALEADEALNIIALSSVLEELSHVESAQDADQAADPAPDAAVDPAPASDPAPGPDPLFEQEPEPEEPHLDPDPEPDPGATTVLDVAATEKEPWSSGRHVREDPGTSVLNAVDLDELREFVAASAQERDPVPSSGAPLPPQPSEPQPAFRPKPSTEPVAVAEPDATPQPPRSAFRLTHQRSGKTAEVSGSGFTVGKSKYAQFQVPGTSTVSRIHVRLDCADGICTIQDDRSLNGTFVNERRLQPEEAVRLAHGDVIRMSDEEFLFEALDQRQEG